jgi:hypothetical protein
LKLYGTIALFTPASAARLHAAIIITVFFHPKTQRDIIARAAAHYTHESWP